MMLHNIHCIIEVIDNNIFYYIIYFWWLIQEYAYVEYIVNAQQVNHSACDGERVPP